MKKFSKIFLALALIMISTLSFALVGCGEQQNTTEFSILYTKNGRVTGATSGEYKEGETINLSAEPDPGYEFDYWYIESRTGYARHEKEVLTKNITIQMNAEKIGVSAKFKSTQGSGSSFTPVYAEIDRIEISTYPYNGFTDLTSIDGDKIDFKKGQNLNVTSFKYVIGGAEYTISNTETMLYKEGNNDIRWYEITVPKTSGESTSGRIRLGETIKERNISNSSDDGYAEISLKIGDTYFNNVKLVPSNEYSFSVRSSVPCQKYVTYELEYPGDAPYFCSKFNFVIYYYIIYSN